MMMMGPRMPSSLVRGAATSYQRLVNSSSHILVSSPQGNKGSYCCDPLFCNEEEGRKKRRFSTYLKRWASSPHYSTAAIHVQTIGTTTVLGTHRCYGSEAADGNNQRMVRLSKRMSELDLCSRREADKWIADNGFSELIWVQGKLVEPRLGVKVAFDEMNIELRQPNGSIVTPQVELDWSQIRGDTIVLHKPVGCVSGQPVLLEDESNQNDYNHQNGSSAPVYEHAPAVQLLTRANLQISETDLELSETLQLGNHLHFAKKSFLANHSSIGRRGEQVDGLSTLVGYVPAGRLDLDSSGLLIFTKSGVMAKKLVGNRGNLEKEYLVTVEPVQQVSAVERQMGIKTLPNPHYDLKVFKSGGRRLWNDHKPLKPVVKAEWVDEKKKKDATIITTTTTPTNSDDTLPRRTLRVVLKEGRKRQIRRMCREILGQHVVSLQRIRVGSISLLNKDGSASLSEGKWRPLREAEARALLQSESSLRKKKKK